MEQRTIKLNFALTLADIREGIPTSQARPIPQWRRLLGLFGWLFFLVCLLFWWFVSNLQTNITPNVQPIVPRPDMDDLWLVLLPTLMPVVVIACSYATTLLKGAMTTEFSEPAAVSKRNSILARANSIIIMIVIFVGIWLLMHQQFVWSWTPSRPKIVVLAVGPWAVLCVLLIALWPVYRRLKLRTLWNTTPSIRRPNNVEINQDGMVTIDARFSCRYRWNHFVRYSETANLLRLHMEDHRILLIPKRAINPDEMLPLRALICENIPEGKFILSDPRFQVVIPESRHPVTDRADTASP